MNGWTTKLYPGTLCFLVQLHTYVSSTSIQCVLLYCSQFQSFISARACQPDAATYISYSHSGLPQMMPCITQVAVTIRTYGVCCLSVTAGFED